MRTCLKRSSPVIDRLETIHLRPEQELPKDYVGQSKYTERYIGQLIRPDGTYYSRLNRNKYYDSSVERNHPAKTPLHVARWAIQNYTHPGDWILDPTMGAGTTAVEALNHGRNVVGVELEFSYIISANIRKNESRSSIYKIFEGDACNLKNF
jgi:DNA modification methylase